jgi:hypothetical protein
MPTVTQPLGTYVVVKKRADGTHRVLFEVPKRIRPSGWSPAIPLPRTAERTGRLDGAEVAAIQRDAKALYADLMKARTGDVTRPPSRSLSTLVAAWQRSDDWPANARTAAGYDFIIKHILRWSTVQGHPDPTLMTRDHVQQFLSLYNDRPTTKRATLRVLAMILEQAINLGWRADNPARRIKVRVPKTRAAIWEQADVDLYVAVAREQGMESIALIVLLEWEIGQRLTDVRQFRPGAEYDRTAGVFRFQQSKTDAPVVIEVSPSLRGLLNTAGEGQMFLFRNERTGKAFTENRLSKTFGWVRHEVLKRGGRHLLLKWLRHSCVVQLARAGCTVPEIASITGHGLASVNSILTTYLPRDSTVARNAQVKRGLVV